MPFKRGHKGFKSFLGRKHSTETKEKMRIARMKNQPMSNEKSREKRSETIVKNKTFVGDKNPGWRGGSSHYRGYGWAAAKRQRRALDHYTCRMCGAEENKLKRAFDVHHILPYNEGGENNMENLVTLCRSCHNKAR